MSLLATSKGVGKYLFLHLDRSDEQHRLEWEME